VTEFNGLCIELGNGGSDAIDRFLLGLPRNKRWVIPLATKLSGWDELGPNLVLSVIAVESNFEANARSRSPMKAQGLMQRIPDTAERFNVRNAYNASQNLRGGMRYLRWLLSYYRGNLPYALAAYNAGEGRVDRYRGVPPFKETQAYVRRIIGLYGGVRHGFDASLTEASPWLAASGRCRHPRGGCPASHTPNQRHCALQTQLKMRAEPHELQAIVCRLAVDQHQVGFDVAIAVIFPVAGEDMIPMAGFKRLIVCQCVHQREQICVKRYPMQTFDRAVAVSHSAGVRALLRPDNVQA
jgi:hypothetical protein